MLILYDYRFSAYTDILLGKTYDDSSERFQPRIFFSYINPFRINKACLREREKGTKRSSP